MVYVLSGITTFFGVSSTSVEAERNSYNRYTAVGQLETIMSLNPGVVSCY